MQFLFLATVVAGAAYFGFKRRDFDYFSLAFFSAVVYFMPGFLGVTTFYIAGEWIDSPIHGEAYAVMSVVMLSVSLAAFVTDLFLPRRALHYRFGGEGIAIWILAGAAFAGLIGTVMSGGTEILSSTKDDFGEELGRSHILFYTAAIMGIAVATAQRRFYFALLFFSMLLFDMYLQFRLAFGIAMLSVLMLLLNNGKSIEPLARRWRLSLLVLAVGFALFASKHLVFAMKANEWELVAERLTSPEWYALFLLQSEPFVTQHLLNAVVTLRFETDWDHISTTVNQVLLFSPDLGGSIVTFNQYLQRELFPDADYGLASNIWAQMWSAGGWPLLLVFIVVFNIVLLAGNAALRMRSSFLRPALVPIFVYWAFYIHRNDLNYIVNLEKRVLLVALGTAVLAELIFIATRVTPSRSGVVEPRANQ